MQKDNSTLRQKVNLRQWLIKQVDNPVVLETHGGYGRLYDRCYRHVEQGVVFEKDPDKSAKLAQQRPTWAVYECDCEVALRAGVGSHLLVNFVDLDPYGEPWPIIDALFEGLQFGEKLYLVVNDGLRQRLKIASWEVKSMHGMVAKYGDRAIYSNYLDICRELLEEKAGQRGYQLAGFTGYYCGYLGQMSHYAGMFIRTKTDVVPLVADRSFRPGTDATPKRSYPHA